MGRLANQCFILSLVLTSTLFSTQSFAQDEKNSFREEVETKGQQIHFGLEVALLSASGQSLGGQGFRASYLHPISKKFAVLASFSQIYRLASGFSLSYSAITATFNYAITGRYQGESRSYFQHDKLLKKEDYKREGVLAVGAHIEQQFLNASSGIFPGTGVSLGISYDIHVLGSWWKLEGRYANLLINSNNVSAMMFTIAHSWDL